MSHDNLDLMAVRRDAALLDALSQRVRLDGHDADPVVGLLAALVDDVDDGLRVDVADRPAAPTFIPEQRRRRAADADTVPARPVVAPVGRRNAVRAVAAVVVAAAVLSLSGVAAAVSGDPLKPYKDVINVVRGGYHDVMPHRSLVAPQPIAVLPKAKLGAAKPARAARARQAITARASRSTRRSTNGPIPGGAHTVSSQVPDRHESSESSGSTVSDDRESDSHSEDPGEWCGSGDTSPEHDGIELADGTTTDHESGDFPEQVDGSE
jgi:hypothetical protein